MQTSTLCSMCNNGRLVTDLVSAEVACESCGIVWSQEAMEKPAEWTVFESGKDSNENQTQMKIAAAAGITEVSIRNRSKDLKTRYCLNTMIWEMSL